MGLTVAVVGLRFGSEFVPIYRDHPEVDAVVVADQDASLGEAMQRIGAARVHREFDEILAADDVDAVHICTPPHLHGPMAIAALRAGKHVASAIPGALDLAELRQIAELQESSGKNYMLMETDAYTRDALHVRDLLAAGEFGNVTFGRGFHFQDMSGWVGYWQGFPPHWNITHAIGPLLMLLNTRATSVRCLGSGLLPEEETTRWGNPFPVETAIFELERPNLAIEVTRSMSRFAHSPTAGFSLFGDRMSFEWTQLEGREDHVTFTTTIDAGEPQGVRRPSPDFAHLLPEAIRQHATVNSRYEPGVGFITWGGDYGGALPHVTHEFVSSIVENRPAWIDAVRGADMTGAGIAAHESAMNGGIVVEIPDFRPGGTEVSGEREV